MRRILRKGLLALAVSMAGLSALAVNAISINFNSGQGKGAATSGIVQVPAASWNNLTGASGSSTTLTVDGYSQKAAITWSAPVTYQWATATDAILKGWLDDNDKGGTRRIEIEVSNIPFASYDVIIYQATEAGGVQFNPPQVNGLYYSYDGSQSTTVERSEALRYGMSQLKTAQFGSGGNVVYLKKGFSGNLKINGCRPTYNGQNPVTADGRGSIAAIQIIDTTSRWGNMGRLSGEGISFSSVDQQDMPGSFDFAFWDNSNLCYSEIGSEGEVDIREVKLALAQTDPVAPRRVKITGVEKLTGGEQLIASVDVSQSEEKVYGTGSQVWTRQVATYTFDAGVVFDTSKPLKLEMEGEWRGMVVKPVNGMLSDGMWSSAFRISGLYGRARSIAVNFNSSRGAARANSGFEPAATWNDVSGATVASQALKYSDGGDSGAVVKSSGSAYYWTGASEPMLKGYIDDSTASSISITNIPFAYYDVVVYQATDTASRKFNPPSVNGRYFSYDGTKSSRTANDPELRYGASQQLRAYYGLNAVFVRGAFSGPLEIAGAGNVNNARGGIAGVQIIEAATPPIYRASVAADTKWSDIAWSPEKPQEGFEENARLYLTVTGNPKISFAEPFALGVHSSLTVDGEAVLAAADEFYENGCWTRPVVDVGTFAAPDCTLPAAVKPGYVGAYEWTDGGFSLRAQNREVLSVNFAGGTVSTNSPPVNSPEENLVPGDAALYGLAPTPGTSWNNLGKMWKNTSTNVALSGAKAFDGTNVQKRAEFSLTATATTTWQADSVTNRLLRGYLDDAGDGASVVIHGIPYTAYDVVVYRMSDGVDAPLAPFVINGTSYTFKDGKTVEGTDDWGAGLCGVPTLGKNALKVTGCKGDTLTVFGKRSANGRATFAAVQIISQGEVATRKRFEATIGATMHFKDIDWGTLFEAGQLNEATVTVDGSSADEVEIIFDAADMMLGKLTVKSSRDVRFTADKPLPYVGQFDVSGCTGHVTYAWPVTTLKMDSRISYVGGSGSPSSPAPIEFAEGGDLTLAETNAPYYVGKTYTGTDLRYAMTFTNADVHADGAINDDGNTGLGVGNSAVTVAGDSVVTAQNVALSHGKAGLTSSLTVKDSARLVATGTVSQDGNLNSVMFGHWNGPTTFTLQDAASFTAASDVLVGKTGNNHTVNVLGGTFTACGIRASASATGTNRINLDGGELVLGETGISWSGSTKRAMPVNVGGDAKITSSAAMPIAQDVAVEAGKTLTLDASAGDVTFSGTVTNAGVIVVAGGTVSFKGGTYQGTGPIVVKGGATLDYGGKYLETQVVVEDGGAVVNTGTAMTADKALWLTLTGDATLGGTSAILFGTKAKIELDGHVLHVAKDGAISLSDCKVTGGGAIVVGRGTSGKLATAGLTVLDGVDLEVATRGTLDLSGGVSLTCRDFKSSGKVTGAQATLVVTGKFDASNSTLVTNLALGDGATLVGSGLQVSDALSLGRVLHVESTASTPGKIAEVPAGTKIDGTKLLYNGRQGYTLVCSGTTLSVAFYANNWIAYADSKGLYKRGGTYVVTNAEGFAWIAASATNGWFAGDVELGADIDLSLWNWTPVAQFTGTFDGKGHAVSGLNNTNVVEALGASGRYPGGPTNDWGYSAYGLFASATNATFRDVVLSGVAIDNVADSAAALLGVHAGGDLSVAGVENASGYVRGTCRAVAGLLTVGCPGNAVGDVVVTGNVNRATIVGSISNAEDGGNVAQILAGTTWGTTFGNVVATNNVGAGAFDVTVAGREGVDTALPVCNFAAAVMQTTVDALTQEESYREFVEANDTASVPIDPLYRTARMLSGKFANDADSFAGWWMDALTAMGNGGTMTIKGTGNTLDFWDAVVVDRNVTIDLNGNCVYALYDSDAFVAADNVKVTIRNGVIYYSQGYQPTVGDVTLENVKVALIPGEDFYDRTVPLQGLEVKAGYVTVTIPHTSASFLYCIDSTPSLAEDWTLDVACEFGNGGTLDVQVPAAGESGFYRVRITDESPVH